MATRRQRAWALLQQRPEGWSPRELAEALEAEEAAVLEDLQHLRRSARGSGLALHVFPTRCRSCGWAAGGEEPRAPGKCPRCKGSWLDEPRFRVEPR